MKILLAAMTFFLAFATAICFCYFIAKILTEEESKPRGKYAVLYNAFTNTYSEPYVKSDWVDYQKYRAIRWKYILGVIASFLGMFGFAYLTYIILTNL